MKREKETMRGEDVENFINKVKRSPSTLLCGCRKYHEIEQKDIPYVVSWYLMRNTENPHFVLAGAKTMVLTWNAMYYQWLPTDVKASLEKDIMDSYYACKPYLDYFRSKNLAQLSRKDIEKIGDIFYTFSSKKSIGFTGASKILHLINPNVFMMWDAGIRGAYHKLHREKKHGDRECYIEFMCQSQEIARELLKITNEDELWKEHLSFVVDRDFVQAFSFRESILKMLDECNYVKFTRNFDFDCDMP